MSNPHPKPSEQWPLEDNFKTTRQLLLKTKTKNILDDHHQKYGDHVPPFDLQVPGDQRGGVHDLQMLNHNVPSECLLNLPACRPVDKKKETDRQTDRQSQRKYKIM